MTTRTAPTDGQVFTMQADGKGEYEDLPAASASVAGKVELATDAEAITGTDTARAVTPSATTPHNHLHNPTGLPTIFDTAPSPQSTKSISNSGDLNLTTPNGRTSSHTATCTARPSPSTASTSATFSLCPFRCSHVSRTTAPPFSDANCPTACPPCACGSGFKNDRGTSNGRYPSICT